MGSLDPHWNGDQGAVKEGRGSRLFCDVHPQVAPMQLGAADALHRHVHKIILHQHKTHRAWSFAARRDRRFLVPPELDPVVPNKSRPVEPLSARSTLLPDHRAQMAAMETRRDEAATTNATSC
jgi:hypothetical protein